VDDEQGAISWLASPKAGDVFRFTPKLRSVYAKCERQFQFPYGAVPSLHFGYSFIIGLSLFLYSPHKIIRFFAPGYPLLILFVIIVSRRPFCRFQTNAI